MAIRDIGVSDIAKLVKPDGSALDFIATASGLAQGAASRVTGLLSAKATDPLQLGGITSILQKEGIIKTTPESNLVNILKNPLENFATMSPMWTLSAVTIEQFNNPMSYRNSPKDLQYVVFASGGRFDKQRVSTAYGAPEYYVNNFVMQTAIAPSGKTGNTNAYRFTFDIIEPHSMGLLLQSLQVAAKNAGHVNYNQAPFVLRLDFMGSSDDGKILSSIKPKFWGLKFIKITFTVSEVGSVYKCEAVPMSSAGFDDAVNVAYTDVKLSLSDNGPGDVKELLCTGKNSLMAYLNGLEEQAVKADKISVPDTYIIEFPTKSDEYINAAEVPGVTKRATADPKAPETAQVTGKNVAVKLEFGENDIGKADFGLGKNSGGNYPFAQVGDSVDKATGVVNRDNIVINPKTRTFQFTQEQKLTTIINQIILSSTYAKRALDPKNLVNDFIKWWRLDTQVQIKSLDPYTGDYAYKYVFRVVPFLVHRSIFSPATAGPMDYSELLKQVVKQYNYIYTGKNVDVLKFDIEINNLFFTGINSSAEANSGKVANQDQKGVIEAPGKETPTNKAAAGPKALEVVNGRRRVKKDPVQLKKPTGGQRDQDTEQKVAESFHQAFISSGAGDLVKVNLETVGDPYWMVDSGISNYFARTSTKSRFLTEDGTLNYEGGDVFIYITFRTPADIDEKTGLYQWPTKGKESPFSGIYRVTQCENTFNDGVFKQKLTCIRQVGQSQDFKDSNPNNIANIANDKSKQLAVQSNGQEEKPKTNPAEEYAVNDKGEGLV